MNYLIKAGAESLIGGLFGNRMMRGTSEGKPLVMNAGLVLLDPLNIFFVKTHNNDKGFPEWKYPNDLIAIGIGAVAPLLISGFLKTSLRDSDKFHGFTSIAVSAAMTAYSIFRKEKSPLTPQEQEKLKTREHIKTAIEDFNQLLPQILEKGDLRTDYETRYTKSARYLRYFTKDTIPEIDDILLDQSDIIKDIENFVKNFKEEKSKNKTAEYLFNHHKPFIEKMNVIEEKFDKYRIEMSIKYGSYEGFNIIKEVFDLFKKDCLNPCKKPIKDDFSHKKTQPKISKDAKEKLINEINKYFEVSPEAQTAFLALNCDAYAVRNDILAIENNDTEAIFKERVNKKIIQYSKIYHPDKNSHNKDNATKVMQFINNLKDATFEQAKKLANIYKK